MRIVLAFTAAALAFSSISATAQIVPHASSSQDSPIDSAPRPLTRVDLETWLDGFVPYALEKNDIAGMVVLVVKDGAVLLQKGYGYADVAAKSPMDPQRTIVEVASVSKTFTWTAVMQLVEQGRLDLDRDINDYLDFEIPAAFGKPITMRHLMTHTPGFEERIKSYMTADSPRSLNAYLKAVPAPERIFPPGAAQAYSNYGTSLAGYIVERISGEEYASYIERHILEPLGMRRSTMVRPVAARLQPDLARNYQLASGEPMPDQVLELVADPAGSLVSTAEDMSRFMRAHLQQGRFADYQLLKPETVELMHAPAFTAMPGALSTVLGFFGGDYNGHRIIVHDGDGSGNHTDMQLLLDDGIGFLAVVNSDGPGGLVSAAYSLRASLFRQFMDRYFPAPPDPQQPTVATAQEHAQLAAGEYEMSRRASGDFAEAFYLAARVAIKANADGTIETPAFLNFEHNRPQVWREVGPFIWREVGGRARLNMKLEEGRVKSWLPGDLSTFQADPVPFLWSAALNVPLVIAALGVLILAMLLWPVTAILRRQYGRRLEIEERARLAHRLMRPAALTGVLFLLGWLAVLMAVGSGVVSFNDALDPWIRLVQAIGLACVAGAAVSVWNAYLTCAGRRGFWAKAGSVLVAVALLDLIWFSFAFGLISAGLNY
jgi:CubicO group peptidase (beta-lactamase class C family)